MSITSLHLSILTNMAEIKSCYIYLQLLMCFFNPMFVMSSLQNDYPSIESFKLINLSDGEIVASSDYVIANREYELVLHGSGFSSDTYIGLNFEENLDSKSSRETCKSSPLIFTTVYLSEDRKVASFAIRVPSQSVPNLSLNFCLGNSIEEKKFGEVIKWYNLANFQKTNLKSYSLISEEDISYDETAPIIAGFRAEGKDVETTEDGEISIPADKDVNLRLFGDNLEDQVVLKFTPVSKNRGETCENLPTSASVIGKNDGEAEISSFSSKLKVNLPTLESDAYYYFCVRVYRNDSVIWIHQGDSIHFQTVRDQLPLPVKILFLVALLMLSGLFSGLNLGLMALDKTELKIIENCGSETEKKYANLISPIRKLGNYLLCSLLFGNVLVNSMYTILLESLTSGPIAALGSTFGIVVFGEIIPQAICSRHGLAVGAKTVWITKFFMLVTFPLSYPISKLLDFILGEEIGNVYNREKLMELIRVTKDFNELEKEEVNMISGALELRRKTVSEVMTPLEDVFMLPYELILNFEAISKIMKEGYTRVPVYENGDRLSITALLNIKDLAFIDPDDNIPLQTVCQFYKHPMNYVFGDVKLDVMLEEFKKGHSHLAIVQRINTEGDGDPFYEAIGVISLEDVIEEIIQSEIIDETDVLIDNKEKKRRKNIQVLKQDFSQFADSIQIQISSQMMLATFQYLTTSVEPFKENWLSPTIVTRLLKQNIYISSKKKNHPDSNILYQRGKAADYFIMILEGRVKVSIGYENLQFESGPFMFFGSAAINSSIRTMPGSLDQTIAALKSSNQSMNAIEPTTGSPQNVAASHKSSFSFIPDYTVMLTENETLYLKITRSLYLAARKATMMEQQHDPSLEDALQQILEGNVQNSPMPSSDNHHGKDVITGVSDKKRGSANLGTDSCLEDSSTELDVMNRSIDNVDVDIIQTNSDSPVESSHLLEEHESKI